MLTVDHSDERTANAFADAIRHACRCGKLSNFIQRLAYLDSYAYNSGNQPHGVDDPTLCAIWPDSAPFSFGFHVSRAEVNLDACDISYRPWFGGAVIFHGDHDGMGNGSAPTFAVTVNATDGWSVHT